MSEKISIQNLVKNFDEKEVLRGINLQVNKGESLVTTKKDGHKANRSSNQVSSLHFFIFFVEQNRILNHQNAVLL